MENKIHPRELHGKKTQEYNAWLNIINRVEGKAYKANKPTYDKCTMSEEFRDFQYFAEWCHRQRGFGTPNFQLDKDLLVKGNKIYGEEFCLFLPRVINMALITDKKSGGVDRSIPTGVEYREDLGKYIAYSCQVAGLKRKYLGLFENVEEAFSAYKDTKIARVRSLAEEWKDSIDIRAYDALMNFNIAYNFKTEGTK